MRVLPGLALLLLAGAAHGDEAKDPLAGRIAGKAQDCLPSTQLNSGPMIADDGALLYGAGRRIWRTQPIGACAARRPLDTVIVEIYGGRICRNDRFRTLTPGMSIPSAPCRFDSFTPYDLPPK